MTISFTGSMKFNVKGTLTSSIDLGSRSYNIDYNKSYSLSNGTAADQANIIWSDTRTLNASASEDLDLAGGLTDAYGNTITFTKIKGIFISAAAANTNLVKVGGGTSGFVNWVANVSDIINIRPGGSFCLMAPDNTAYGVTATTADILTIANSGGSTSVTYDIILVGVQ